MNFDYLFRSSYMSVYPVFTGFSGIFRRLLTEQPAAAAQNVEDEEYPESYSRLVEQLEKFFSQDISIKRSKNGGGKHCPPPFFCHKS